MVTDTGATLLDDELVCSEPELMRSLEDTCGGDRTLVGGDDCGRGTTTSAWGVAISCPSDSRLALKADDFCACLFRLRLCPLVKSISGDRAPG